MKIDRKRTFINNMRIIDIYEFEELLELEHIEYLLDASINGLLMNLEDLNDVDFIKFTKGYGTTLYMVESNYLKIVNGLPEEGIDIRYGIIWDI